WLEYRYPLGVLIHRQLPDGRPMGSFLLDMTPGSSAGFNDAALPPGSSWANPLGSKVVTVNWTNATGAQVSITPNPSRVPDVIGELSADARNILQTAGYAVTVHIVVTCNGIGEVVSQLPSAGTPLAPGLTVDIGVGRPPPSGCQ